MANQGKVTIALINFLMDRKSGRSPQKRGAAHISHGAKCLHRAKEKKNHKFPRAGVHAKNFLIFFFLYLFFFFFFCYILVILLIY